MAVRRCWFIEEIEIANGNVGHRQTVMEFDSVTGEWVKPESRLVDKNASLRWDEVMKALSTIGVGAIDLRRCINPVFLMDYCNDASVGLGARKLGQVDVREVFSTEKLLPISEEVKS